MGTMREIKARLIKRIKRTDTVESFRFILKDKLDFIAGQFMQVIFDEDNRENKEMNKYLSFSSSPTKEYIEFTKRLSESRFSEKLKSLKTGNEVLLKAPFGNCVFKEEYKKIGFLIGGIGITPVISIIGYIIDKNLDIDVSLFYSNRTETDIAFKAELDSWQVISKKLKLFYMVTEVEPRDKNFIYGRINKDLLLEKAPDLKERILFSFGPPKMVEAMSALCLEVGCNKEKIKTESFIGY